MDTDWLSQTAPKNWLYFGTSLGACLYYRRILSWS